MNRQLPPTLRPADYGQPTPRDLFPHYFPTGTVFRYETALSADVARQRYSVYPRCWYVDALSPCRDCGQMFLFSAQEQRAWYEDYGIYVDARAVRCRGCRRGHTQKQLRREYDQGIAAALASPDPQVKQPMRDLIDRLLATNEPLGLNVHERRRILDRQIDRIRANPAIVRSGEILPSNGD